MGPRHRATPAAAGATVQWLLLQQRGWQQQVEQQICSRAAFARAAQYPDSQAAAHPIVPTPRPSTFPLNCSCAFRKLHQIQPSFTADPQDGWILGALYVKKVYRNRLALPLLMQAEAQLREEKQGIAGKVGHPWSAKPSIEHVLPQVRRRRGRNGPCTALQCCRYILCSL